MELIEGEIVNVPPVGSDPIVSAQNPLVLPGHSEPEPDTALLRLRSGHYRKEKPLPADVLLLIEMADSTLRHDREIKVPLHAACAVPETWLIDTVGERLTRFVEPTDSGYARPETVGDLSTVETAAPPGVRFDLSRPF